MWLSVLMFRCRVHGVGVRVAGLELRVGFGVGGLGFGG